MDSVDCIIDNTVIYLCFLGYSKQPSLFELNILCTGSVLLSSVGWSAQWSAWLLVQLRGLGMSPGNSHGLEGPTGMSWGWAPPEGLWCALWGSVWCLGAGLCSLHGAGAGAAARKPGSPAGAWLLCWKAQRRFVGTGDSLLQKLHQHCVCCPHIWAASCVPSRGKTAGTQLLLCAAWLGRGGPRRGARAPLPAGCCAVALTASGFR